MSHYSATRVRAALGHFVLGKALSAISSVLFLSLVVRNLSVAEYGAYAALLGFLGLICTASSFGLESVVERFLPEFRMARDARENHLVAALLAGRILILVAGAALVLANMSTLTAMFDAPGWADSAEAIACLVVLFGLLNLCTTILDSRLQQRASQLCFVSLILVKVLVVLIVLQDRGLDFSVVVRSELTGYSLANVLALLALWLGRAKGPSEQSNVSISAELGSRAFRFASYNFGAQLLHQAQGPNALRLMAASIGGAGGAASVGLVLQIAELVQRYLPTTLLVRLIRPVFVSRYIATRDFNVLNCFSGLLLKLNFTIVAPIVVVSAVTGGGLIEIFSGGQYRDLGLLLTLALLMVGVASHTSIISLLANTLEMNQLQFEGGVFSLIGAAFGFALAGPFGMAGLLVGALIFGSLYNSFAVLALHAKGFYYRPALGSVWRIGVLAVAAYGWTIFVSMGEIRLAAQLAIGTVCSLVYASLFVYVIRFSIEEREYLSRVVPARAMRFIVRLSGTLN